jgi:hypothetical protein
VSTAPPCATHGPPGTRPRDDPGRAAAYPSSARCRRQPTHTTRHAKRVLIGNQNAAPRSTRRHLQRRSTRRVSTRERDRTADRGSSLGAHGPVRDTPIAAPGWRRGGRGGVSSGRR